MRSLAFRLDRWLSQRGDEQGERGHGRKRQHGTPTSRAHFKSRMNVDEPLLLQAHEFGDAARNDVPLRHTVERAPIDFPFVVRVATNEKSNPLCAQCTDLLIGQKEM